MLQREADRNDYRKTDDGTSTVTTNKTKNYVTRPRRVEDRLSSVSVEPQRTRANGRLAEGVSAQPTTSMFVYQALGNRPQSVSTNRDTNWFEFVQRARRSR
jgi:hypothetical protein